jgi:serine/threonine protein kinase
MSPEQVQSAEITPSSDIYSLGAVMYELLTGYRPFRANSLSKLLHQIVFASPAPIHTLRDGIPEEIEEVVMTALRKEPEKRFTHGLEFAGALTRLYQQLRNQYDRLDKQEQFDLLRKLRFFHDFSHAEIWEVLRASEWCTYQPGDEIIREGELDDRFYIIVSGSVSVQSGRRQIGMLSDGDCFGETSYERDRARDARARELDSDGAVIVGLPAALQQGVPAHADRASAGRRAGRRHANRLRADRALTQWD